MIHLFPIAFAIVHLYSAFTSNLKWLFVNPLTNMITSVAGLGMILGNGGHIDSNLYNIASVTFFVSLVVLIYQSYKDNKFNGMVK